MSDILQYTFFQNALFAVILIGLAGGIIGTYIVTRRMVFITGGITHASFESVRPYLLYFLLYYPHWE